VQKTNYEFHNSREVNTLYLARQKTEKSMPLNEEIGAGLHTLGWRALQ